MGVMDKFLNAMKLNEDGEADDFYDDGEDDYYEEQPTPKKIVSKPEPVDDEKNKRTIVPKVTQIPKRQKTLGDGMEVCVIKPTTVEDAREITETLLANRTVVLNLEGLDVDIAQRIIDFTSGSTYAIRGNLQKISQYIFIITPPSVDISGDIQEIFNGSFEMTLNGEV